MQDLEEKAISLNKSNISNQNVSSSHRSILSHPSASMPEAIDSNDSDSDTDEQPMPPPRLSPSKLLYILKNDDAVNEVNLSKLR